MISRIDRTIAGAGKRLAADDGFTLIEVLVALIVLVVGILGTAKVVTGSEKASYDSELQQIATEQGEKQLENVRGLGYANIGHGSTVPTTVPDGGGSLAGGSYGGEQLVSTANESAAMGGTAGDGAGTVAPVTTFSVSRGSGQPALTGKIYTFVTWRDEECGILNLSDSLSLGDLETQLEALNGQLTSATSNISSATSSINTTLTTTNSAITSITSTLIGLIPGFGTLKTDLDSLNSNLTTLRTKLTNLQTAIDSLTTPINSALDLIADLDALDLDLCDMGEDQFDLLAPLLDLDAGGVIDLTDGLDTTLGGLSGIVSPLGLPSVRSSVGNVTSAIGGVVTTISGVVCSNPLTKPACLAILNPILLTPLNSALTDVSSALGVFGGAQSPTTSVNNMITDVNTFHDSLLAITSGLDIGALSADTTHNTKRVTVAVTIDGVRADATPQNPVWLSTVVTDQSAALLGLG